MGHSNGKITAPVNLGGDVYPTLGIGSTSYGYELGYACANTHGKINKWSKKKPVRYANLGLMSDEQFRAAAYGLSFTEGGNHDYGIFLMRLLMVEAMHHAVLLILMGMIIMLRRVLVLKL